MPTRTPSPAEDPDGTARTPRPLGHRRIVLAVSVLAGAGALWLAGASTLSLGANAARAEIEARLGELTGQPVLVDGRTEFSFLPRPRLSLFDVRVGGAEPGPLLVIDQLHAELDLSDALFGRADIANLILVRPEVSSPEFATPNSAPTAGTEASADAQARAYDEALSYGRSILDRFDGVRNLELREGAFRGKTQASDLTSVNLRMNWPSREAPAELSGSFVWNGQPAQVATRVGQPERFLAGDLSPLRFSLASPALDIGFEGEGAAGGTLAFDGSLRISTPSLARATRWMGDGSSNAPDFGQMSLETRVVHRPGQTTALDPIRISLGQDAVREVGHGAIEAVFRDDGRPSFSGTLAFPALDLDRFAAGIAPLPRRALDYQRPMTVSFIEDFDLDLRVSADEAGLGTMPLKRLAASLMVSGARATLDIGDSELFGGRAQGRFHLDLSGERPMAGGRVDLTGVEADDLAAVAGLDAVGLAGRANLTARFEVPATNWAEILRDNSSTARLTLSQGSVSGLSPDLFEAPGERPLAIAPAGAAVPFRSLEASFGTRGPYATLDAFAMAAEAGQFEAGGFLSFLDDRVFVEGLFRPSQDSNAGNDLFTTSQPVPFRMHGEWPTPTLSVAIRPDAQPI